MNDSTAIPGFDHSAISMLIAAARRSVKHAVAPLLDPLDLTPLQAWMILLLRETGPLSLTELAARMWLDHPTTSRLVHSLEERKLLQVQQDPSHGRRIRIGIHEDGAAFAQTLSMASENFRVQMEQGIDEAEKQAFRRTLGKLLGNLATLNASIPKRKGGSKGRDTESD